MKKYSFLIYHQDYEAFLQGIRDVGVVHIIEKQKEVSEEAQQALQNIAEIKDTLKFLKKRDVEQQKQRSDKDGLELVEEVNAKRNEIDKAKQEIVALNKEMQQLEPWGDFSPENITRLEQNGIQIHFFVSTEKYFQKEWQDQYFLDIINHVGSELYFIVAAKNDDEINIEAEEIEKPDKSLTELQKERDALQEKIQTFEKELDNIAASYLEVLDYYMMDSQDKSDFDQAWNSAQKEANDSVMLLEGWVPENKEQNLIHFLEGQSVVYVNEKPQPKGEKESKQIPILLKNNKFASTFELIGKLFSLPNYKEIDLTPFFAPFFMMFFGFCLGDAGYGVLFLIVTTIIKPRMKPDMKPVITMVQYFGLATVIFGVLTGTLFGIPVPEQFAFLAPYKELFIDNQEMFDLAIYVGAGHVLFGMCIKAANQVKQNGWGYALSTIGWFFLIVSSALYLMILPEGTKEAFTIPYYFIGGISAVFILFLNNPKGNIFANFGAGLWDVYSNITGLLGDLLSYIRLFALGLSSAILGYVFNQMATTLSPATPVLGELVFVIILVFGHSINIFMSSLGSLVHPMRLIFVEFFKNAGFTGGGKEYKPFVKINK